MNRFKQKRIKKQEERRKREAEVDAAWQRADDLREEDRIKWVMAGNLLAAYVEKDWPVYF